MTCPPPGKKASKRALGLIGVLTPGKTYGNCLHLNRAFYFT